MNTTRPFLPGIEAVYVMPDQAEAMARAVVIAAEAEAPELVALARGRLQRLASHLDMLSAFLPADGNAVELATFVHPLIEEACSLLCAAEQGLAGQYTRRT